MTVHCSSVWFYIAMILFQTAPDETTDWWGVYGACPPVEDPVYGVLWQPPQGCLHSAVQKVFHILFEIFSTS